MRVAVVANDPVKAEWLAGMPKEGIEWVWLNEPVRVPGVSAYIDFLYNTTPGRLSFWQQDASLILINDVLKSTEQVPSGCVRFNGWPTFLNRPVMEIATAGKEVAEKVTLLLSAFNKTAEWVPDIPGFVSARVVSMIINEACFALEEGVSTKEEIDTAMKLGTNYPLGPFEWGEKIGWLNIYRLLDHLSGENIRYTPAALLKKEAFRK
jgi:3-hydroxybutyryl-CoA dehydrogenase